MTSLLPRQAHHALPLPLSDEVAPEDGLREGWEGVRKMTNNNDDFFHLLSAFCVSHAVLKFCLLHLIESQDSLEWGLLLPFYSDNTEAKKV